MDEGSCRKGNAIRVAIVGGGCAALTAAYELSRPEHKGRYQITVYQMGFRLGGKGASGRGIEGRIEEHGLHLWLGFYENAFRLMRECYAELGRDRFSCPIVTWRDAFEPAPHVAVTNRAPNGDWEPWIATFAGSRGLPGDPLEDNNPFAIRSYLTKAATLAVELLRSASEQGPAAGGKDGPGRRALPDLSTAESLVEAAEWVLRNGRLATAAAIYEATDVLRAAIKGIAPQAYLEHEGVLVRLVDAVAAAARRQLGLVVGGDVALQRTWQVVDLILAIMRGCITFGLAADPRGFDAIDDYEWREWLQMNGASPHSLDSGFVRGIYDLVFAYEDGDAQRPSLSAAAALRGAMRMFFTYRGALFWRMSAGMGDVVFAPLYEVLKKRGVRFEFFHRLQTVEPGKDAAGNAHVARLHFDVQARVKKGSEYQPLVDVNGLPCWPATPDYEQLEDGERMEREGREFESPAEEAIDGRLTLEAGKDLDFVVLGIGAGAVPSVCAPLIEISPRWREMAGNLRTVATQALQLWMKEDMASLGWTHPPVNLSGWVEPFDTWADMSHLIPAEGFDGRVRSIAYFCSPLKSDSMLSIEGTQEAHRTAYEEVRTNAQGFLNREISALWPRATGPDGQFRWDLLVGGPEGEAAQGPDRLDTQFWTANVRPSDRYALAAPGKCRYRISPLDMTFDNLAVAGDWTESGLNTGCVESAVMSGLLAAHALSRSPALEDIIGYDHP